RRSLGPSSTWMSLIIRSSAIRSWLASALAAADSISLRMSRAAPRLEKRSRAIASSIGSPRTWSATSRAFLGARRTKRALALTTGRSAGVSFLLFGAALDFAPALGLASAFAGSFLPAGFLAAGFFAAGLLAGCFFSAGLLS